MGDKVVIYRQKLEDNLRECYAHLERLNSAMESLESTCSFPISREDFEAIIASKQTLAYSDQIIYRFSKLQDSMGAKLFKSVLLYLGENINKPFLDMLNQLEKIDIVRVDEWFEIRDLRNEIAHDYDDDEDAARHILNAIYQLKSDLSDILDAVNAL